MHLHECCGLLGWLDAWRVVGRSGTAGVACSSLDNQKKNLLLMEIVVFFLGAQEQRRKLTRLSEHGAVTLISYPAHYITL